ncbi:hypothetical protein F4809DRAFT_626254 [Biscogniauxia mediterranea]|nr:hypothetical protein F4809DRAFT_626254 [Biscogniauxia mediterranea]
MLAHKLGLAWLANALARWWGFDLRKLILNVGQFEMSILYIMKLMKIDAGSDRHRPLTLRTFASLNSLEQIIDRPVLSQN